VRYNVSQDDGRAHGYPGIYIGGGSEVNDNQVFNNTVYISPATGGTPSGVVIDGVGTRNALRNNVIVTGGALPLLDSDSAYAPADLAFQGNAWWAGGIPGDFKLL